MIRRSATGWFIQYKDRLYNVTPAWLDEWERHQLKPQNINNRGFNRLRYYMTVEATDDQVMAAFAELIDGPRIEPSTRPERDAEFAEFVREASLGGQRADR